MKIQSIVLVGALPLVFACGPAANSSAGPTQPERVPVEADQGAVAAEARDPGLPWWQGKTPHCSEGELKRRTLTWGGVFWCASAGVRADQSLQNDLSRLARCVHESVSAFQEEPEQGKLGAFLARAHESGLNPVLCGAVRVDGEARTYHGRRVEMERQVESQEENDLVVRYRFGCEDCSVAAETTATIAKP